MAGGVQIRGVIAQIKWSYYVAAAIHGYTVQHDKEKKSWSLTGTVVSSDAFRLAQQPLEFVAPHAKGAWRWTITEHSISNGTVIATLTPIQE